MPPKGMTKNPSRPTRYRPGKVTHVESSSDSDSDASEEQQSPPPPPSAPAPSASSFPKSATRIATNLQDVDLNAQNKPAPRSQNAEINEDDFETEESAGSGTEGGSESSEEEDSSGEEASSSEDDVAARRKLMRPVFLKKDARKDPNLRVKTEDERWAEEEAKRIARANDLVQSQLDKNAAARAAGKKFWDDEDNIEDEVDDTDGLDPEAERAAWKVRELMRVKRERDAIIATEKEREEVERRRNLSKEERDAEDQAFLDGQQQERDGKGKMGFMQKYFHKGAYFTDDLQEAGLAKRDIMGGRYEGDVANRDTLPEYMQIRDLTKLGKKGRTRYKDMRSEDTGSWGGVADRRKPGGFGAEFGTDERFRPDFDGRGRDEDGPSGANASILGDRKRHADGDRSVEKRVRVG